MYFVGVDLAWSDANQSGIAILRGDELVLQGVVKTDQEIIRSITAVVSNAPCVVAIDAPLTVPNLRGSRLAEQEINSVFRRFEAGAHPANRSWLTKSSGRVRGEDLVKQLEAVGIRHDPALVGQRTRVCVEVYPHPAMVVLFGLTKTLKYKPRQGRSYEERWEAFKQYQERLSTLPLAIDSDVLAQDVTVLRASALKRYEDRLDAIFCAYIAFYAHHRPEDMQVFGSVSDGYIFSPRLE